MAPALTVNIDAYLRGVIGSFRKEAAMIAANTTDVSRSAATRAIGACVIAQSASPYDAKVQAPPSSPLRQPVRIRRSASRPRPAAEMANNSGAVNKNIQPV